MGIIETLKSNYIFAVIRANSKEEAIETSRAVIKGGIKNIEITYTTPNASEIISFLSKEFQDDQTVVIGAGTVMTTEIAEEAIKAGAEFLVSPHLDLDIKAVAGDTLYFPGCGTVTEVVTAMRAGCEIIKAFPGGLLGPKFIKDIHGPIPNVDIMPSGGVDLSNVLEWKKAGACAIGVGSALSKNVKSEGYESVTKIAQDFVKALEG